MLFTRPSASRSIVSLDGVWQFALDSAGTGIAERWFAGPLPDSRPMPVPSSFNDVTIDSEVHDHVGVVFYQRVATAPAFAERLILRFGSVTHAAQVWVNDVEVATHTGGYLPFEVDITDFVSPGEDFRLTVAVDNRLSWQTIPPGYIEQDSQGRDVQKYFHDFYNYAGIHRSVLLYTRPAAYISDITITTDIDGTTGKVTYAVQTNGGNDVVVKVLDGTQTVAEGSGNTGTIEVRDAKLWKPGEGYMYTLEVRAGADVYREPFGIRTVEIRDSQVLINGEPFYFRGYGRHEDNLTRGKGHDNVLMVHDFEVMAWQGANSFRTSHYPYAEEVLDYADQQGFVVIDETAAVGLNSGISGGIAGGDGFTTFSPDTINDETQAVHADHIRELIARDKNHPSVVLWSIANEPETTSAESREYFEPLAKVARESDPSRPVGYVNVMLSTPDVEQITDLFDVIMLNRYYGWYLDNGNLADAEADLRAEIDGWIERYPDKPIIFTEYGPDTLAGLTDYFRRPWSEEFQTDMIGMYHRVFDDYPQVVGEQMWNFADFQTTPGIMRVGGNKKGMFTRDRLPKQNAYIVRDRWLKMREEQGN